MSISCILLIAILKGIAVGSVCAVTWEAACTASCPREVSQGRKEAAGPREWLLHERQRDSEQRRHRSLVKSCLQSILDSERMEPLPIPMPIERNPWSDDGPMPMIHAYTNSQIDLGTEHPSLHMSGQPTLINYG